MNTASSQRLRIGLVLSILILTPLGFYTKFYIGPAQEWIANSFSGVLYEIFWCLVIKLGLQRWSDLKIALVVFVGTTLLEFLQLWHPPLLELIRQNFLGRTLLGNSFAWSDLAYYVIGCLLGYGWLRVLASWAESRRSSSSDKNSVK